MKRRVLSKTKSAIGDREAGPMQLLMEEFRRTPLPNDIARNHDKYLAAINSKEVVKTPS